MAAIESGSGGINREDLDDITTCCICTEVFTDPKALPCIHTFCMKCLQEHGLKTNKGPGDEMPCPICRRLFKIPSEGLRGLPKNFFIERLIQVSKVSDPSAVTKALCSVCLEESKEQEGKQIPTADTYCVECKHKLCEECCSEHRKFKFTKNHTLMPIDEYESGQNMVADLAPMVCKVHEQKVLDVYCADCKTVVCAICFIEDHANHKGGHVNRCVDGLRKQMKSSTEAMNGCIAQAHVKKAELVRVKEEMQRRVESLECDVEKRKDEIKQLTDEHASTLLQGLCSERQSRLKEIQMATDDIDGYLSNLESYNSYCQRLIDKGSANDICSAVSDLFIRACELEQQCQPRNETGIPDFRFCFRQSELEEFLEENRDNLVGEIEDEGDPKPKKKSKQSLLVEKTNECDLLRKETEIDKTAKESLRLACEQLRVNAAKEVQVNKTLAEELRNAEANIVRLKQELDNNKAADNALQTNNDKLKQELEAEKTTNNSLQTNNEKLKQELKAEKRTNNSLQTNNDKLVVELSMYKAKVTTLETNAEKLRKELEATKTDELRCNSDTVLIQTIKTKAAVEGNKPIVGLTILDKELFVVTERNSEVEVYDTMKLTPSRRWNLKDLLYPKDIGSCNIKKCLYIMDYRGDGQWTEIFRVRSKKIIIQQWSAGGWSAGEKCGRSLSVTDESNVLLAVDLGNRLNEYSPDGQLLRKINLSPDAGISDLWHAVKVTNGYVVVSHGAGDLHRVCTVDVAGKLKKSFGGKSGSGVGQMYYPVYLCVDGNGFLMVADELNHRILLLDRYLQFSREILSKDGKYGLRYPSRILLDEISGRLFVASNESNNRRLLIFDFK